MKSKNLVVEDNCCGALPHNEPVKSPAMSPGKSYPYLSNQKKKKRIEKENETKRKNKEKEKNNGLKIRDYFYIWMACIKSIKDNPDIAFYLCYCFPWCNVPFLSPINIFIIIPTANRVSTLSIFKLKLRRHLPHR